MGNSAPFTILSSKKASIRQAYFEGNNVSEYGSAIFTYDSTIDFGSNVNFANSTNMSRPLGTNAGKDCDIFVGVFDNDFQQDSSCIKSDTADRTLKPPNTDAPTASSVPSATAQPEPLLPIPRPNGPAPTPLPNGPTPTPLPNGTMPTLSPTGGCFSGRNTVDVKDVGNVRMDHLKIGDFVRSGDGRFSLVYGFGHWDYDQEELYLQIHFARNAENRTRDQSSSLEISAQHLIIMEKDRLPQAIRASDVVVGDWLNGLLVTNIQTVYRRGVFAPLTYSGDIVVSGIRASNYVDILDHDWPWNMHMVGHTLFFPQRVFCNSFIETCKREGYINGIGYLSYLLVCGASFINLLGAYVGDIAVSLALIALFRSWNVDLRFKLIQ
jgi:Hint module